MAETILANFVYNLKISPRRLLYTVDKRQNRNNILKLKNTFYATDRQLGSRKLL